eukprot:SAG22_NODE_14439_length_374_cov_1.436364_1_plen_62_part_10
MEILVNAMEENTLSEQRLAIEWSWWILRLSFSTQVVTQPPPARPVLGGSSLPLSNANEILYA